MKKIVADCVALCLFALKDIIIGEELRYDYGPNDGSMYWRKPGYKSLSEQSQNTVSDAGGAGRSIARAAETDQSQNW